MAETQGALRRPGGALVVAIKAMPLAEHRLFARGGASRRAPRRGRLLVRRTGVPRVRPDGRRDQGMDKRHRGGERGDSCPPARAPAVDGKLRVVRRPAKSLLLLAFPAFFTTKRPPKAGHQGHPSGGCTKRARRYKGNKYPWCSWCSPPAAGAWWFNHRTLHQCPPDERAASVFAAPMSPPAPGRCGRSRAGP